MKRLGPFPAMSMWTSSAMRQEMRQDLEDIIRAKFKGAERASAGQV